MDGFEGDVISKALLMRTIGAMEAAGRPIVAIKLQSDGSITLLTSDVPVPTRETDDWLSLAGSGGTSAQGSAEDWTFDPVAFEAARIARGGRPSRKRPSKG